jgi:hypothetical protein
MILFKLQIDGSNYGVWSPLVFKLFNHPVFETQINAMIPGENCPPPPRGKLGREITTQLGPIKGKKLTLEQAMKAQNGSRNIALLFL